MKAIGQATKKNNSWEKENASEGFRPYILAPTVLIYYPNLLLSIDMAKPHWLWARLPYFPITTIILLSAAPIWAQSCYNANLPNLACSKFQDQPKISPISTGPTLEPSLLPPLPDVRLRPRNVTAICVDGYAYQDYMGDDGNKRVLGGPSINIVSLEPTSCGNFYTNYNYAAKLHHALPQQPKRQLRRLLRNKRASTITISSIVVSTTTTSPTTIVSSSSTPPSTQAPRPISNSDVTLPKGAIVGIGVGSTLSAFYRHRQRSRKVSNEVGSLAGQWPPISEQGRPGQPGNEAAITKQHWEISEHSSRDLMELGGNPKQGFPVEAPGDFRQAHELAEGR
ncbi:hypothetical protein COCSADRAFT_31557 [Bipolaris sorokiniana ND90Pr]|uniref:Uncharacterized protein n=1 Tax=Cochliobolus sativus (strain ND90Pr / ATCC 201652) TaxID=665912 RepID=M2S7T3_COCSN|nr:uncharacterized protein COCSADRAFT_31557 [Bipolaris sorokiniana ND90Pr]EMD58450.1 hypothetical protein COCSADRAFT_31557 [Bipolaris sorokiniana ND90Pr]